MIGFAVMMCFISIILLFLSISLLRGNYSSIHGKIFDNTHDKVGYAKASGKPVLGMAIGIALAGVIAIITLKIIISIFIIVAFAIVMGIWFIKIQRRF